MPPNHRIDESSCINNEHFGTKAASVGDFSISRTSRFALTGLTLHGPYFHFAFRWYEIDIGYFLEIVFIIFIISYLYEQA